MSKRASTGQAQRDLFPGHGAGKGSAERSVKWRKNYDCINWVELGDWGMPLGEDGFEQIGPGKLIKRYASNNF